MNRILGQIFFSLLGFSVFNSFSMVVVFGGWSLRWCDVFSLHGSILHARLGTLGWVRGIQVAALAHLHERARHCVKEAVQLLLRTLQLDSSRRVPHLRAAAAPPVCTPWAPLISRKGLDRLLDDGDVAVSLAELAGVPGIRGCAIRIPGRGRWRRKLAHRPTKSDASLRPKEHRTPEDEGEYCACDGRPRAYGFVDVFLLVIGVRVVARVLVRGVRVRGRRHV